MFGNGYVYDDSTGSSSPVRPPDRTLNQGALVLGDELLMMMGGHHIGFVSCDYLLESASAWLVLGTRT